jgi:hypothetical protein
LGSINYKLKIALSSQDNSIRVGQLDTIADVNNELTNPQSSLIHSENWVEIDLELNIKGTKVIHKIKSLRKVV